MDSGGELLRRVCKKLQDISCNKEDTKKADSCNVLPICTSKDKPPSVKSSNPLNVTTSKPDITKSAPKVYELIEIKQDPNDLKSITIIKETFTEGVIDSSTPSSGPSFSNRYQYCKEVISPIKNSDCHLGKENSETKGLITPPKPSPKPCPEQQQDEIKDKPEEPCAKKNIQSRKPLPHLKSSDSSPDKECVKSTKDDDPSLNAKKGTLPCIKETSLSTSYKKEEKPEKQRSNCVDKISANKPSSSVEPCPEKKSLDNPLTALKSKFDELVGFICKMTKDAVKSSDAEKSECGDDSINEKEVKPKPSPKKCTNNRESSQLDSEEIKEAKQIFYKLKDAAHKLESNVSNIVAAKFNRSSPYDITIYEKSIQENKYIFLTRLHEDLKTKMYSFYHGTVDENKSDGQDER